MTLQKQCNITMFVTILRHPIRFPLGPHPRPRQGSLQCCPDLLAVFKLTVSKGGGYEMGREGRTEGWLVKSVKPGAREVASTP